MLLPLQRLERLTGSTISGSVSYRHDHEILETSLSTELAHFPRMVGTTSDK